MRVVGELTARVAAVPEASTYLIDAVRRLEAECAVLKAEARDAERDGELRALVAVWAMLQGEDLGKVRAAVRALLERRGLI